MSSLVHKGRDIDLDRHMDVGQSAWVQVLEGGYLRWWESLEAFFWLL